MSRNEKNQNQIEDLSIQRVKEIVEGIDCKCYFGLSRTDINILKELFDSVKPNPNSNNFPDFIFPNGFIEHFAVTSSNEGKKGAIHKAEKSKFEAKSKEIEENLSSDQKKVKNEFAYPTHSYGDLVKSFEKNFKNHIESLNKYEGEKDLGIFLVDYDDYGALSMAELSLEGVNEIYTGDLGKQEILSNYRLTRDKKMLDWLYEFKDKIKCLIFLTSETVEIIKLSSIPCLQTLLPYEYAICSNFGTTLTESWVQI